MFWYHPQAHNLAVLLELGFMINPEEFEWIMNPQQQQRLASAIADGVTEWFQNTQ